MAIGSACGTIRVAVDQLRQQGIKAGLLKIRCFRPFPAREIAEALSSVKVVAVLDRSDSFGGLGGPIFSEIRSALYDYESRPKLFNYVYGIGGRELDVALTLKAFQKAQNIAEGAPLEQLVEYLGVRE